MQRSRGPRPGAVPAVGIVFAYGPSLLPSAGRAFPNASPRAATRGSPTRTRTVTRSPCSTSSVMARHINEALTGRRGPKHGSCHQGSQKNRCTGPSTRSGCHQRSTRLVTRAHSPFCHQERRSTASGSPRRFHAATLHHNRVLLLCVLPLSAGRSRLPRGSGRESCRSARSFSTSHGSFGLGMVRGDSRPRPSGGL